MEENNEKRERDEGEYWFGKYWIGGILVSGFMIGNFVALKEDGYFLFNGFLDSILNFPLLSPILRKNPKISIF